MRTLIFFLVVVSLPWVADAVFRWVWACLARRPLPDSGEKPASLVVLVPSRGEGANVRPTLESVLAARRSCEVGLFLILDGPDPEARAVAEELGVPVIFKEHPGPTKAAALRFAAQALEETIRASSGVLILDVGSQLTPTFFESLRWPEDAAAMQGVLHAEGGGPGEGAALSERLAQTVWDKGKQALGWGVRLRGTGTLFRPEIFLSLVQELRTQIEDTEASFLLAARGARTVLVPAAVVVDQKPLSTAEASRQRARWLVGQAGVLRHHWREFLRFLARRPLEALSWGTMLASRPLSLTTPLRLAVGIVLFGVSSKVGLAAPALWGLVVAGSAAVELLWLALAHPRSLWPVVLLAWSWVRALALAPKARLSWHRGRGKAS